jgi:hypothetical protein
MQHRMIPMIARSSDSRSNQLLSREGLSLRPLPKLKSWWGLISTPSQLT